MATRICKDCGRCVDGDFKPGVKYRCKSCRDDSKYPGEFEGELLTPEEWERSR